MNELTKAIQDKLSAEFSSREIKWLPRITKKGPKNNRVDIINSQGKQVAGCVAHINARQVMTRLDDTVGAGQWEDAYQSSAIPGGVECALTVMGVTKTDVGVPSSQDAVKGAYSDALKRAAVKFGIGRHLYDIPTQWLEFDGWKITGSPNLPPPKQAPVSERHAEPVDIDDGPGNESLPAPKVTKSPQKRTANNGKQNGPRVTTSMLRELHGLGTFIYKDQWDKTRADISANFGKTSSKDWSIKEYYEIVEPMKEIKERQIEAEQSGSVGE